VAELAWDVFGLWAGGPNEQTDFCCLLEECYVVESSFIPRKKCAKCDWACEFFSVFILAEYMCKRKVMPLCSAL
jgi:hypothetical protein